VKALIVVVQVLQWPAAERSVPDRIVVSRHAASPARRPGDENWLAGLDEADRRGAPKTRRTVSHHILVHMGGGGDRHGRRECLQPELSRGPAPWETGAGQARLRNHRAAARRTLALKNGDAATA